MVVRGCCGCTVYYSGALFSVVLTVGGALGCYGCTVYRHRLQWSTVLSCIYLYNWLSSTTTSNQYNRATSNHYYYVQSTVPLIFVPNCYIAHGTVQLLYNP